MLADHESGSARRGWYGAFIVSPLGREGKVGLAVRFQADMPRLLLGVLWIAKVADPVRAQTINYDNYVFSENRESSGMSAFLQCWFDMPAN